MKRVRVREATVDDLNVLVAHRRGMWGALSEFEGDVLERDDAVYREWVRRRMKSGKFVAWIAETREAEPVASGAVWVRERQPHPRMDHRQLPYLLSMYTEPEYRGNGLATRIVKEAVKWAKREGYPRITLHASHFGENVYRAEGFEDTTEMVLRLKPGRGPPPKRPERRTAGDPDRC